MVCNCYVNFEDEIFIRWVDCHSPSRIYFIDGYEMTRLPLYVICFVEVWNLS